MSGLFRTRSTDFDKFSWNTDGNYFWSNYHHLTWRSDGNLQNVVKESVSASMNYLEKESKRLSGLKKSLESRVNDCLSQSTGALFNTEPDHKFHSLDRGERSPIVASVANGSVVYPSSRRNLQKSESSRRKFRTAKGKRLSTNKIPTPESLSAENTLSKSKPFTYIEPMNGNSGHDTTDNGKIISENIKSLSISNGVKPSPTMGKRTFLKPPCSLPAPICQPESNYQLQSPTNGIQPLSPLTPLTHLPFADGNEDLIFDDNNVLISGSLKALIRRILPRKDYFPDKNFIFGFLLNARLLVAPSELLNQILQYCIFEQSSSNDNFKRDTIVRFFWNIVRLLREWTETFPYDFANDVCKERLDEILRMSGAIDNAIESSCNNLSQALKNKLTKLERYEAALVNLKSRINSQPQPSEHLDAMCSFCESPLLVAQQLTHIELERLSMIGPEEFVERLASDRRVFENSVHNRKVTRNIDHYADWFNRLTSLVTTDICKQLRKKNRVHVIEYYIDVAQECFNLGNFNSLMAIIVAFNNNAVVRLKRTWSKVNQSKLEILEHQGNPSGNFSSYRATLKAAKWRSETAKQKQEKIIVPVFTLMVKDLIVLHEGCNRRLPNGYLNYAKFAQFAKSVEDFLHWKQIECPFPRDSKVLQYLLTTPLFSETALEFASFACEAPDHFNEKDSYKKLKAGQYAIQT